MSLAQRQLKYCNMYFLDIIQSISDCYINELIIYLVIFVQHFLLFHVVLVSKYDQLIWFISNENLKIELHRLKGNEHILISFDYFADALLLI